MESTDTHSRARLEVLGAALCFGTTGTSQQLLRPSDASTLAVGAARIIIGAALLVLFARGRGAVRIGRAALPLLLAGGAGVAIYQLSFFAAVDRTGVAVGTVVAIGSGPALAGLLGFLLNGESLTARWAAATGLACAGIVLLGAASGGDASIDAAGIGLAVLSGSGYASYTVLAKRLLMRGHAPEQVMAATFGTGALLLIPVLALEGVSWLGDPAGLALAIYLGAITTAVAYVLFARGLKQLSAGETATLVLAEPLTALLLGAAVLGERPGVAAIGGALLVLCGLLVLAVPRRGPVVVAEVAS
jgi:DME family drug/metabolite transporter